ncbi:MAG TPA: tRNA preQ1(34) S-adenosylmethionine ribosyltransferase-isomerase QueA [candidate division WOR-3 bacterium]|uniref:S-adenosylmethionine:tRNA ribosyltransferase-isomerase n=1 Tax=candidate division WOR-3 bacterium TaxID=2052148 RepID=A0A9C9ELS6_UNCW3|nr:tRNA preQ1(34) S-adenosylmethionine ribosyltransferase-isomerase QueA [candidate division WOR-3 bacterium]
MKLSEFSFELPKDLIAQYPLKDRAQAKLLVLDRKSGTIHHHIFYEITNFFENGDALVLNNTKVFKARFKSYKETGGRVEILLIKKLGEKLWEAMISHAKRTREKTRLYLNKEVFATVKQKRGTRCILEFNELTHDMIKKYGEVPLPHYIRRDTIKDDEEYYQTIFAKETGSIAAPTAGLHFTNEILENLKKKNVEIIEITLHIGPGTFKPIRTENIEEHKMEPEYYEISEQAAEKIEGARRIFGVGTSVCRALETFARKKERSGQADLFIYPGHRFKIIESLITNFHMPCSTPLLLVSAFAGKELIFKAYKAAIKEKYRFLSYGDAMLIL